MEISIKEKDVHISFTPDKYLFNNKYEPFHIFDIKHIIYNMYVSGMVSKISHIFSKLYKKFHNPHNGYS